MSHVTLTRIKKRREPVLDAFTCRVWCASVVAFLIAVGVVAVGINELIYITGVLWLVTGMWLY
jgi:hypothetical protein